MKKFKMFLFSTAFVAILVGLPKEANGSCIACTIYDNGSCAVFGWGKISTTSCVIGMGFNNYPKCAHGKNSVKECPVLAEPD